MFAVALEQAAINQTITTSWISIWWLKTVASSYTALTVSSKLLPLLPQIYKGGGARGSVPGTSRHQKSLPRHFPALNFVVVFLILLVFDKYQHRVVFSTVGRSQGNSRNGRQGSPSCTVARPPGAFLKARRPGGDLTYRPPYSLFRLGACCHGPTLRV